MAIDLRGLNNISVDTANKTVTVGGGASMGGVINAVADAGYQIRTIHPSFTTDRRDIDSAR